MKKAHKILIILLIVGTSLVGCARKERPLPEQERPMYGGQTASEAIVSDTKSNEAMIRQVGGREAAAKKTLEQALAFYQRGYFELAMHQYNRAWLLDPKNPEVFNGFALVLNAQNQPQEALSILEKCLELNPKHAISLCRLARQYQNMAAAQVADPAFERKAEDTAAPLFQKSLVLYQQASEETTVDADLSYIYYQWAIALAIQRDPAGAWEKIKLSRKHGGQFIEAPFIEALSKEMPEP